MLDTVEHLAAHGELTLTPLIRDQLARISRATLARRLAEWPSPKGRRTLPRPKPSSRLRAEIPVGRYDWDETRVGALEIDLVEHNGGSSLGHFAYTLTVVDVVSGWSRRRAILGRSQAAVHAALAPLVDTWPVSPWGLHSDNGSEFLSDHLLRFCQARRLAFTRSRPYHKNDHPHVEQKNRQFVREIVGYDRYDTPAAVDWLNRVYAVLDPYANLVLPMRKLVGKQRQGSRVRKTYDRARTPFQRLIDAQALAPEARQALEQQCRAINPLQLHRQLEQLLAEGPGQLLTQEVAAD